MLLKKSILALTLTTALLATSCAAPKKAVQENRTEAQSSGQLHTQETTLLDATTAAEVERMVEEHIRRLWEHRSTTDEATERVTEIFDTSQPTDSTTGTPPLLSRTTERREARQTNESREQTETAATDSASVFQTAATTLGHDSETSLEAENRQESEARSKEEKRSSNTLAWIAISLALLSLLAAVVASFIKTRLNNH